MTQADSVLSTPPTNTPIDKTPRFETLKDAEDALMEQGFKLVPNTCNWIDTSAQIDAGVYPVEEANGVSKYRIEYRSRHHRVHVDTTRRHFLVAVGGGTAAMLAATIPEPAATAPASALDPVFDPIARHRKARRALREAESAHSLAEKEMDADGLLFPRTLSIGNPSSSLGRPVSRSHADIDTYSPADLFPLDNKREHEELSAAMSLRDARIGPLEEAMNDAAIAEQVIVEELVGTEPTTIGGVLALLRWQRDYSEGSDFLEGYLASFLMESIEAGLNRIGGLQS